MRKFLFLAISDNLNEVGRKRSNLPVDLPSCTTLPIIEWDNAKRLTTC